MPKRPQWFRNETKTQAGAHLMLTPVWIRTQFLTSNLPNHTKNTFYRQNIVYYILPNHTKNTLSRQNIKKKVVANV